MDWSYNVYCKIQRPYLGIIIVTSNLIWNCLHEVMWNLPQKLPQDKQDFLGTDLRWGLGSWADILDWPTSLKRASTRKIFK